MATDELPDRVIHIDTTVIVRVGRPSTDRRQTETAEIKVLIHELSPKGFAAGYEEVIKQIQELK